MSVSAAVDVLFLTFNCAKALIDVPVFARHVENVFHTRATELPELVVFSLQEIAPLSYAFIGGSFLNSYINRFESALNLAAEQFSAPSTASGQRHQQAYSLIRFKNVGYTAIALFARESGRVHHIREAEVGFGAAEMGNKGAVGLRLEYHGEGGETTLTFIATHLAAMEWNLAKRNENWASIMRCMTFGDAAQLTSVENGEGEGEGLLAETLHDMSIFNPTSHLFVGGDLNYRISAESPTPGSAVPSTDPDSEDYYPKFFARDQLTQEREAGRTLHGLTEQPVMFAPTYKYDVIDDGSEPVKWKFAAHRYPSWTDRILYLDLPPWVANGRKINVRAYDSMPVLRTSDHRPVYLRVDVPLVGAAEMRPVVVEDLTVQEREDPRVTMPVEIDTGAWARREAAKQREAMLGWSTLLWSTREGAVVVGTFLVATMGAYWFFFGRS